LNEVYDFSEGGVIFTEPKVQVSEIYGNIMPNKEHDIEQITQLVKIICGAEPIVERVKQKACVSKCFFCGKSAMLMPNEKLLKCSRCYTAQYCSQNW